jgi:hypothetical protein
LLRFIPDDASQIDEALANRSIRNHRVTPHGVQEFLFRHELTMPLDQETQHFE